MLMKRVIGPATLYHGNCIELMPQIGKVSHVIGDPPYEKRLHDAKAEMTALRTDGGPELKALDFDAIDDIRDDFVALAAEYSEGWLLAFCTMEGVARWADAINASPAKYKRACFWVKPDATPQMNGQGPAQGGEPFIVAWCGKGHAKWNAGGKRGVYTHCVNGPERDGRHKTEKPRRLMSELVADFTSPGDVILDPFMGSGTTGVSAVMAGRSFIGIELNATYFEIACERIETVVRQGKLFPEMDAA